LAQAWGGISGPPLHAPASRQGRLVLQMSAKEQSKLIINLSRKGKIDGDTGVRQLVSEALKSGLDLDYSEKPFFRSALWEATWKGHEAIVKLLAEKGASVEFKDYEQRTPMHEAAYYGHINLVEYFLDKGHNIDVADKYGQTPLFRAVDGGRHDVVELLIKRKAATNTLDADDVTVHHCAAFQGLPSMSQWLLYKGAWKNRYALDENARPKEKAEAGGGAGGGPGSPFPQTPLSPMSPPPASGEQKGGGATAEAPSAAPAPLEEASPGEGKVEEGDPN